MTFMSTMDTAISRRSTRTRWRSAPRIKRLVEYIGKSYSQYLSKLDDLVLLMDESHPCIAVWKRT